MGRTGSQTGLRTADIALGGVAGMLFILLAVVFARTGDLARELASARKDADTRATEAEALKTRLQKLEGEMNELRLAAVDIPRLDRKIAALEARERSQPDEREIAKAVDAALEKRREVFARDIERRGEEMMDRFAKDADLEKIGKNLRRIAEDFRGGAGEGADGGAAPEAERREKAIAKGLDGAAQFFDLWREYKDGKITREEFEKRRRELRDNVRKEIEKDLTPEERKRLEERFRGLGGGGQGGGQGGAPGGNETF